jgi:hypothetical protein
MRNAMVLLFLCVGLNAGLLAAEFPRKKLIATGWDQPDDKRLAENIELMEKRPFDGVVIQLDGTTDDGKACPMNQTFSNRPWKQEWFTENAKRLASIRFRRFNDNFILVGANPGDVDWFDDAGWATIVEHWRIAARLARGGGLTLKGILFDPEPYNEPYAIFTYHSKPQRTEIPFAEYYAKVRQRGREVMTAVAKEYPDITIFCYFLGTYVSRPAETSDPKEAMANTHYGLLPAFLDGWLDAAPPTVKIVDGCEAAYRFNSEQAFLDAAVKIKGIYQRLVSEENRAKYRAQVQVGFGLYLDAHVNPKDSPWYIDPLGGTRSDRLRANVTTALSVTDEYVWIYGEKYRWWPTPNGGIKPESWPDVLPGCDRILAYAADPAAYADSRIRELKSAGKLVNLVQNPNFDLDTLSINGAEQQYKEGNPPLGFGSWQADNSKGTFTWDRKGGVGDSGAALASGVLQGCFIQSYPAKSGESYGVRVQWRTEGNYAQASVTIRWKDAQGRWTAEMLDRQFLPFPAMLSSAWQEITGAFRIPDGAAEIVILLNSSGGQTPEDKVWFDDLELIRLD